MRRTLLALAVLVVPVSAFADPPEATDPAPGVAQAKVHRFILPPYFEESRGETGSRALYPLYFESWAPGTRSLLVGPYYRRRGPGKVSADVLFPIFWNVTSAAGTSTTLVPPLYYRRDRNSWDFAVAPLLFAGAGERSDYFVVPPLVWHVRGATSRFDLFGPYFRARSSTGVDWGIAPLFFSGSAERSHYDVLFPLYWHFGDDQDRTSTTLLGPILHRDGPSWWSVSLLPLAWLTESRGAARFTLLPLVHYAHRDARGRSPSVRRLVTPLFAYLREGRSSTLITPLYQRHRGDTWLDSVAPLFWRWGDARTGESNTLLFPLLYQRSSPNQSALGVFPLFYMNHAYSESWSLATPIFYHTHSLHATRSTTWVAPTFEYSTSSTGWRFNLHPLLYVGREREVNHQVLFPFFWNYTRPRSRATVLFPLYFDFVDRDVGSRDVVLFPFYWQFGNPNERTIFTLPNILYRSGRTDRGAYWNFQIVPLWTMGSDYPGHSYWQLLYGLLGYERAGRHRRMFLLYADFGI